jgi:predicted acylesterase/phospholipase RssA
VRRTFGVVVMLLYACVARGAGPCDRARNVLRVGIPQVWTPAELLRAGDAVDSIVAAFRAPYAAAVEPCDPRPPLEIQITAGNDYQILAWMEGGLIDAAILPDFSVALLEAVDGIHLFEVASVQHAYAAAPVARARVGNGWRGDLDAGRLYGEYLEDAWNDVPPRHRLVFASHLSTTGFVSPLLAATHFLEGRDEKRINRFWERYFAGAEHLIDCTTVDDCFDALARRRFSPVPAGTSVVFYPGERTLAASGAVPGDEDGERLLIDVDAARRIFGGLTKDVEVAAMPEDLTAIVANAAPQFATFVKPDPLLGFRDFDFNIDELMELIRQEQIVRGEPNLALVLPGGGVKSAYQTRIIDELYGQHYLRNSFAPTQPASRPLEVGTVIGTSGGALLGYFVSQLDGTQGPLFPLMWGDMRMSDVFAATDLMGYVSVVFTLTILCVALALASGAAYGNGASTSIFHPGPAGVPGRRRRLLLPLGLLLLGAPVLVRVTSGDSLMEDAAELSGICYSLFGVAVMIVDQLFTREATAVRELSEGRIRRARQVRAAGAVILAAAMAGALLGWGGTLVRWWEFGVGSQERVDPLHHQVTFGLGFLLLSLLILGGGLAGMERLGRIGNRQTRLSEVLASVVVTLFYFMSPLPKPDVNRLVVAVLIFMALLATALYVMGSRKWAGVPFLATLTTTVLIALLVEPAQRTPGAGWLDYRIFTAETAGMTLDTMLVLLGIIVLMIGVSLCAYESDGAFKSPDLRQAASAMIFVILYIGGCLLLVEAIGLTGWITALPLMSSYWLALLIVGSAVAAIALYAAKRTSKEWPRKAVTYLVSPHPNAVYVRPRWGRLLLISATGLVWWNFVLAPAVYGNRRAHDYFLKVVSGFHGRHTEFEPTARFIAPTSLLDRDRPKYYMFLPRKADCPAIPRRLIETQEWNIFRSGELKSPCGTLDLFEGQLVNKVIFASGSPFPVFPAHHVDRDWLIDGGYSSNIPVDAAKTASARQLLIIHSSNPVREYEPSVLRRIPGRLVANLARLPGFLFERSQEVDRLSRRGIFVASLAPPRDVKNWPSLTDFDRPVIDRMKRSADEHMRLRIGTVESWGEPSFQVTRVVTPAPALH